MNKQAIITKLPDWADNSAKRPMEWQTAMDILDREINTSCEQTYFKNSDAEALRKSQIKEAWRIISRGFAD